MAENETKVVITGQDLTRQAFDSATKNAAAFSGALAKMFLPLSALAVANEFRSLISSQMDLGVSLEKLHQKTNISVEDLSAYQYAARISGLGNDALGETFKNLSDKLNDAIVNKGGEAAMYFRALGVQVTDNEGRARNLGVIFDDLSGKLSNVGNAAQRTAAENKLLGRSGSDIDPLINNLARLKQEAFDTGNIVSSKFAKDAKSFNDAMARMSENAGKLARMIAGPLVQSLDESIQRLNVFFGLQKQLSMEILERDKMALQAQLALLNAGKFSAAAIAGETEESIKKQITAIEAEIAKLKTLETIASTKKTGTADVTSALEDQKREEAFQKYTDSLKNRVIALDQSLMSEEQRLKSHYDQDLMLAEDSYARGIIEFTRFNELKIALTEAYEKRKADIEKFHAEMAYQERMKALHALSALMGSKHREMFNIGKAAAISETAIKTYNAAMGAYSALSAIPYVGPALGAAAAAAIGLYGAEQVNMIRQTQFGGGGGGRSPSLASSSGGGPSIPQNVPSIDQNQTGQQRTVQIQILGDIIGNEQFLNDVILPGIRDAIDRADQIIISGDSRQAKELAA